MPTSGNGRYVTLEVPRHTRISGIRSRRRSPRGIPPPPPEAAFPIGYLGFRLRGMGRGEATTVTLYPPAGLDINSYWKYGPTPANAEPHWYRFDYDGETGAQFLPTGEIVLHFTDGARGDDHLRRGNAIAVLGGPALTIPALAPLTIDLPGEETAVGVALHNPTNAANDVVLEVRDAAGSTLQEVPLEEALAGKGQRAGFVCELLDCAAGNGAAAVVARGRQGHLQSLFMVIDRSGRKLDGVSGAFEAARRLYFPIVDAGRHGATRLFVFNPALTETEVTFTLYRADGGSAAVATRWVAAGGFVRETVAELFGGAGGGEQGYVEARAARAVLGFEFLHDEESFAALAAQTMPFIPRSRSLYAPHFEVGGDRATTLYVLTDLARYTTRVRIRVFDNHGNLLGEAERELDAGADGLLLVGDVGELLHLQPSLQPDGLLEGYLQLDAELIAGPLVTFATPRMSGAVAVERGGARTVLPLLEAEDRQTTSFLQVAHSDEGDNNIFTTLSLLNPGPQTALVTLRVFDSTGRLSAPERIESLAPGARLSGELGEFSFFGPAFRQLGGHLQVLSDRPLISFAMFGDGGGQFLAAIPGREGIP